MPYAAALTDWWWTPVLLLAAFGPPALVVGGVAAFLARRRGSPGAVWAGTGVAVATVALAGLMAGFDLVAERRARDELARSGRALTFPVYQPTVLGPRGVRWIEPVARPGDADQRVVAGDGAGIQLTQMPRASLELRVGPTCRVRGPFLVHRGTRNFVEGPCRAVAPPGGWRVHLFGGPQPVAVGVRGATAVLVEHSLPEPDLLAVFGGLRPVDPGDMEWRPQQDPGL